MVLLLALVLIPPIAVCVIAWTSFKPPRTLTKNPVDLGLALREDVAFPSGESTLRGWLVFPPDPPRGVVLLVHGWGSDSLNLLEWSSFLARGGWASLAFDMRGHGRSDPAREASLPSLAADIRSATAFLRSEPRTSLLPLAILGHSMGGAATLLALSQGLEARAAVISSAFARIETITDHVLKKWFLPPALFRGLVKWVWILRIRRSIDGLEPETAIQSVTVPLLLTHGTEDEVIPDAEVRRLARAAPDPDTLTLTVPGAMHMDLVASPVYQQGVLEFLDEHLGPGLAPPG